MLRVTGDSTDRNLSYTHPHDGQGRTAGVVPVLQVSQESHGNAEMFTYRERMNAYG